MKKIIISLSFILLALPVFGQTVVLNTPISNSGVVATGNVPQNLSNTEVLFDITSPTVPANGIPVGNLTVQFEESSNNFATVNILSIANLQADCTRIFVPYSCKVPLTPEPFEIGFSLNEDVNRPTNDKVRANVTSISGTWTVNSITINSGAR